jgi:ligand-binding sensor domain-containing protein
MTKIVAWFLLALVGGCTAQDVQHLGHQVWSTEEGLPQSSVHAIAQTPDGYLWIATEGGLARFDGLGFRVYGRANDKAFTSDDLCCLAVQPDGALLVGTADGVVREAGGAFSRPAEPMPQADALAAGWDWSPSGVSFAAAGRRTVAWTVGKELSSRVQSVFVDRQGLAWAGMRSGLAVLHPADGSVQTVDALNGDSVLTVFEDAEGNHWVGTETSGLHVLRQLKFRSEASVENLAATAVVENAGGLWVGTRDEGLRRVVTGKAPQVLGAGRTTSEVVLCLAPARDGGVWVGTPDGLNLVTPQGTVRQITSANGLPGDYVRALAAGRDGSVWVGTQHGLVHVAGDGKVERVWTSADGLGGDMVGALLVDADGVWVGSSGGLVRVDADGAVKNFAGPIVTALAQASGGGIWVATRDGAMGLFNGERLQPVGPVFPGASVLAMTPDRSGRLWLRLDRGIRQVNETTLRVCAERRGCSPEVFAGVAYGRADGLPNDEVVAGGSPEGWLGSDGEMFFPTRRGVGVVDTLHLPIDRVPPPVVLEQFLVDDEATSLGDGTQQIPFGHERFTMEYAGLAYTAPSEVRYRVRLEGFEKAWTDAGTRRTATYTNLPPGLYRFRVQAVNGDGVWNESGAELQFRIIPPYYRRWWFIGLVVLAVLGFLGALYWMRLSGLRRGFAAVLAERNRMAREIHDTLTQDFVGTSLQLDIVARMLEKGKVEAALEQVRKTRRLVTEGLDEARRRIWELRASNAEGSLPARLTRMVELGDWGPSPPAVKLGGAFRALDPRVEEEILRIAQEALKNAAHHAQASETRVDLHYSDEALLLTVVDNGVGFRMDSATQKAGHFGLLGMRERAEGIGGLLKIESAPGKGTAVTLRVAIG